MAFFPLLLRVFHPRYNQILRSLIEGIFLDNTCFNFWNDVSCPLELHELMHTILKISKLEIIEDSGHFLTLEQPKNHDNGAC